MHRVVLVGLVACSPATPPPAALPSAPSHGRIAIHGMVLFGRDHHYLEHIPMMHAPHDEQLVMQATLRDDHGAAITGDFGAATYTLEPAEPFSLDDLVNGRITAFAGTVHRGSFEQGGEAIARIRVTIDRVLVARHLPAVDARGYFAIGDGDDMYLTRAVGPVQQIVRVRGLVATASRVDIDPEARLLPGEHDATIDGRHVAITVETELWCVIAPDFVQPCG